MGLGILFLDPETKAEVHSQNITHNLAPMARAVGVYGYLWYPEDCYLRNAEDLGYHVVQAYRELCQYPEKYKKYDAPNGWGTYDFFVPWLGELILACYKHPNAIVGACR